MAVLNLDISPPRAWSSAGWGRLLSIIPTGLLKSGEATDLSTEAKPFSGIRSLRAGARRFRRLNNRAARIPAIRAPAMAHPMPMPAAAPEPMEFELCRYVPPAGNEVELLLEVLFPGDGVTLGGTLVFPGEVVAEAVFGFACVDWGGTTSPGFRFACVDEDWATDATDEGNMAAGPAGEAPEFFGRTGLPTSVGVVALVPAIICSYANWIRRPADWEYQLEGRLAENFFSCDGLIIDGQGRAGNQERVRS